MKLRYERGALADLDEIFAYIAADSREAAARLVARIEEVAAKIAASPYMGEATRKSGFRRFPVGNYLIVYEVAADDVIIHYADMAPGGDRGKGRNRSVAPLRRFPEFFARPPVILKGNASARSACSLQPNQAEHGRNA